MATDDEQFRGFVTSRYAALVRTAQLLAPDPAQAEDLVQSALTKTFTHWRSVRDPLAAEAYTRTTLIRLAMRGARRYWRGERPTASLPEPPSADSYAAYDDADAALRALATLPTDQRVVLVLRYYLQLTEAEIADAMKCPTGTVKSRANRGIAALRASGLLADTPEMTDD